MHVYLFVIYRITRHMCKWSMQRQRQVKGFRISFHLYIHLLFHSTCFSKMQSPFHHCFLFFPFTTESQSISCPPILISDRIYRKILHCTFLFLSLVSSCPSLQQKGAQESVSVSRLDFSSHKTVIKVQLLF